MEGPPAARKPCCVCDGPGGQHCTKCKSRHYCGKACQLVDWHERGHKAQCKQLSKEFQDRLLDPLMQEKLKIKEEPIVEDVSLADGATARLSAKLKEEPPIVDDAAQAAGSNAAARLSAARTPKTAVVEAGAVRRAAPDWRGICDICFDKLLSEHSLQSVFYSCCCKTLCKECSDKCREYDERCLLCRTPAHKSDAEWLCRMQKHVDKGHAGAQFILGETFNNGGMGLKQSHKRAAQLHQLAAAQGSAFSQTALGLCYENGKSVKIDFKAAALWYRRAAEQGYPEAQYYLGQLFYNGTGVAQSYYDAVKWYRLATQQGDRDALFNLGVCHAYGRGVPRDVHEALRLFQRAGAKGMAQAPAAIKYCERQLAVNLPK